ncbi:hypothetical protein BT96DRAFT_814695, partial [Gymnopus androsaceus JB14]
NFTQAVWKDSTNLGCGYSTQCEGIYPGSTSATLHVCLYNPPGNVVGQASYIFFLTPWSSYETDIFALIGRTYKFERLD